MRALLDSTASGTALRTAHPRPRAGDRHERILALQRAAGNRAVTGILRPGTALGRGGTIVLQRAGTGLAGAKVSKKYAKTVSGSLSGWAGLSLDQRMSALLEPANAALASAGVPPVKGFIDPLGRMRGTADRASFARGLWQVWFNPDYLQNPITAEEFGRSANTAYHECRHAEQAFRVARKLAGEGRDPDEIKAKILVPLDIAKAAGAKPLKPKEKAEWAEAERWQFNMEVGHDGKSAADVVNARKDQALTDYYQARAVWRGWQKVLSNDPGADPQLRNHYVNELLKSDGAAQMKELTARLQEKYIHARELAKQSYLQYAKMPVEEDAWATGRLIQQHLGLEQTTAEAELANLDSDERTMVPIAQSDLGQLDVGGVPLDLDNLSTQEQSLLAAIKKSVN